jgi:uncharacterized protein YjiS (DUF1127 family)
VRYLDSARERSMDSGRWIECDWQAATPRQRRSWGAIITSISRWRDRARQRRQLASLDDRMLADLGISRCDVMRECDKPFWAP